MPNNKRSKLFMKTWPPPKTKKDNDRPLTATLDKPNVLNISFIDKVDMTRMGEELLAIRNLCLIPWSDGAKNGNARKRPLSAIGVKSSSGDDCNNNGKDYINRRLKNNRTQLNRTRSPPKSLTRSTKLPEPCKSCGRSDQPERLHSHPKTSLAHRTLAIKDMDIKLPVKNIVQKPVAIKYRPRHSENAPRTCEKIKLGQLQQGMTSNSIPAKRTLTCYLCAREFGTASLPLHEPKCLERWHRQNDTLPKHLRRNPPPKPSGNLTKEEWDEYAWNASKMSLVPCDNCKRTFLPDRLLVHKRSCKPQRVESTNMSLEKSKSIEAELQTLSQTGEAVSSTPQTPTKSQKTFCEKAKLIFTNITVEPLFFFYVLPSVMCSLATQNLNLEKACRVNLALNETICDALTTRNSSGYTQHDEQIVQKLVSNMYAVKNVIQSFLPSLILLFLGSWSDRHRRRKPCIILPVFGEAISTIGFIICVYYLMELPLEVAILSEAVPPSLTGGWFALYMGVFSYVSEITTTEMRTLRIGAVNMFSNVCLTIGIALSGVLYKSIGFYGVYSLGLVLYTVGILYGSFRIKDVPAGQLKDKEGDKKKSFLADFFNVEAVKDTIKVAFKEGKKNRKKRICFIMVLVMVIIGPIHGEMNVVYLFTRYKFHWNEIDYSIYATCSFIAHIIGTLFSLLFFSKYLKLDDAVLGMISTVSKIAGSILYAFAPTGSIFFLGILVEILNGTSFIAMRSIMSKLVPPDELGKINSLFGVCEALMPLVYGPMYSMVYSYTIKTFPGAFYLLGGGLLLPSVGIFLWLYLEHRRDEQESLLEEQKEAFLNVKPING